MTKTTETMLKIRKGATAGITMKALQEVFAALGGYTVAKGKMVVTKEENIFDTSEEGRAAKIAKLNVVEALPAKFAKGVFYVTNVQTEETVSTHWTSYCATYTKTYEIATNVFTTPSGKTEAISARAPMYEVMGWLLKETEFKADVLNALGMGEHVTGPQRDPRDLINTGTCGVCGKNHKRNADGTMVHHGYRVDQWFGRSNGCFGVGYQPIEVSSQVLVDYIVYLNGFIAQQEKIVANIESGTVETVWVRSTYNGSKVVKKGEKNFDRYLAQEKANVEGSIRGAQGAIKLSQDELTAWVVRPLPDAHLV